MSQKITAVYARNTVSGTVVILTRDYNMFIANCIKTNDVRHTDGPFFVNTAKSTRCNNTKNSNVFSENNNFITNIIK